MRYAALTLLLALIILVALWRRSLRGWEPPLDTPSVADSVATHRGPLTVGRGPRSGIESPSSAPASRRADDQRAALIAFLIDAAVADPYAEPWGDV